MYIPPKKKIMRSLYFLIFGTLLFSSNSVYSQSNLLESVKRSPKEAALICKSFRELNSKGISANSEKAIKQIANKKNLTMIDAEILSMYVIGLHCPNVK